MMIKRNVLITTQPDDAHAVFVKLALETLGHEATLWLTSDMPSQQLNSVEINQDSIQCVSQDIESSTLTQLSSADYDVVWWRRPGKPFIPRLVHPDDLEFVRKENSTFFNSMPYVFDEDTWWVNPYSSGFKSNSKLLQLKLANKCGLNIPPTLISNDPMKIKNFINANSSNGVIYKSFTPNFWFDETNLKISYTRTVIEEQLPSDEVLQTTPGIFQKKIDKQFELRVTCFGDHHVAVKIDSQNHPKGKLDWRAIPATDLRVSQFTLPEKIHNLVKVHMRELGIVFGCYDFIVTPENEYYFLEVNEQGQFLWIESINSDIKMLDRFVKFLVNKNEFFDYETSSECLSMSNYIKIADEIIEKNIKTHVDVNKMRQIKGKAA